MTNENLSFQALQSISESVTLTDPSQPDNPIVWVNDAFINLTGYREQEILGRNCRFLQGKDTSEHTVQEIRAAVDQEQSITTEIQNYRRDGTRFWNKLSIDPIYDKEGNLTRFLGIQRDITDRKTTQKRYREQSELLRRVTDRLPGVVYQFRVDSDGQYSFPYMSEGFESLSGVSSQRAQDDFKYGLETVHPDDRDELQDSIRRAVEQSKPWTHEYRYLHADGTMRWVRASSVPESRDDGSIVYSGIILDITDQIKLENRLKNQMEFLENINNQLPGVVFQVQFYSDGTANFPYLSDGFEQLSGISIEQAQDDYRNTFENVHPEDRDELEQSIEQAIANVEFWDQEYRYKLPDGTTNWVRASSAPQQCDDGSIVFTGIVLNITERKRVEQQRKQNEQFLKRLNEIASNRSRAFDEKVEAVLALGCEYFECSFAYVTKFIEETDTLEVAYTHGTHEIVEPGVQAPVDRTYCRRTIRQGQPVELTEKKSVQETFGKELHETFGFNTYLGGRLVADNELMGTVCFASPEERSRPFRSDQKTQLSHILKWLSFEFEIQEQFNQLQANEQQLKQTVEERNTLLQEVHHRVKNNLQMIISLIKMQRREISDGASESIKSLQELKNRVYSMALIHDQVYERTSIADLDAREYLEDLARHIIRSHSFHTVDVELQTDIEPINLHVDTLLPCGIVTNELITNSLQHAFSDRDQGRITLEFRPLDANEDLYELIVADNGTGWPEDESFEESSSLGLTLVKQLVRQQLRGDVKMVDTDNGVRFKIQIHSTGTV